jgi:hypothetical protein
MQSGTLMAVAMLSDAEQWQAAGIPTIGELDGNRIVSHTAHSAAYALYRERKKKEAEEARQMSASQAAAAAAAAGEEAMKAIASTPAITPSAEESANNPPIDVMRIINRVRQKAKPA